MAIDRRTFLIGASLAAQAKPIPIIDAHIHLFDPGRPQGVPWPAKDNAVLYKPALPNRYRKIAAPHGVVGAIEVECSAWVEDNQWVLDVAANSSIIVGTVGNLEPGKPEFRAQLDRFHKNTLFRGMRYGNLWGRDLGTEIAKPEFVAGLKALAQAGLVLDAANPNAALIDAVVRVTDKVPELRVVFDHLPQLHPLPDLAELGKRPQCVRQSVRSAASRMWPGSGRCHFLQTDARAGVEHFRRGSSALWERLAEQRSMGAVRRRAECGAPVFPD